jgi:NTP pyrophosphatase (non-canonical NTP hydrolase)
MTFDEYQKLALRTASLNKKNELFHVLLGLCGEAGEIAEKTKKIVRDHDSDFSKLDKADLEKELGDVLWHIAVLARHFDISLDSVATTNIDKLSSRLKRGQISGSGDNR